MRRGTRVIGSAITTGDLFMAIRAKQLVVSELQKPVDDIEGQDSIENSGECENKSVSVFETCFSKLLSDRVPDSGLFARLALRGLRDDPHLTQAPQKLRREILQLTV